MSEAKDDRALARTQVSVSLPMSYVHLNQSSAKPLLLFLHGYSDSGWAFLKRAYPEMDSRYEILAPNGLFPVPIKSDQGWRQAYSWYFADFSKNQVEVPPSVSVSAVQMLLKELDLQERPKIVIGFSQGGFFLPFLFPYLANVQKMFAIGSAFRPEDYARELPISLDAIHGDADHIISIQRAKESFEALKTKNPLGQFFEFKGLGHTMNDASRQFLKQQIDEVFE